MDAGPRIDAYEWRGGREAMLRWGPEDGPVVIAALPLLEEANRCRAFVVTILRSLAEHGVGGVLPDMPGTGESAVATDRMRLPELREAFAAAASVCGDRTYGLAVRSGALLDEAAGLSGRWQLSPQSLDDLLREWRRVAGGALAGERVEIAGNLVSRDMLEDLAAEQSHPGEGRGGKVRAVRYSSDPRPADLKCAGAPLWRGSEPGNDVSLARQLAADIADWVATCET